MFFLVVAWFVLYIKQGWEGLSFANKANSIIKGPAWFLRWHVWREYAIFQSHGAYNILDFCRNLAACPCAVLLCQRSFLRLWPLIRRLLIRLVAGPPNITEHSIIEYPETSWKSSQSYHNVPKHTKPFEKVPKQVGKFKSKHLHQLPALPHTFLVFFSQSWVCHTSVGSRAVGCSKDGRVCL